MVVRLAAMKVLVHRSNDDKTIAYKRFDLQCRSFILQVDQDFQTDVSFPSYGELLSGSTSWHPHLISNRSQRVALGEPSHRGSLLESENSGRIGRLLRGHQADLISQQRAIAVARARGAVLCAWRASSVAHVCKLSSRRKRKQFLIFLVTGSSKLEPQTRYASSLMR